MKLILTKDVPSLGKKGDVVEVAKGYARNYLLPKKFAIEANPGALEAAEKIRQARVEAEEKARRAAEGVAQQLAGTRVVIAAHAGDEGQLYGSEIGRASCRGAVAHPGAARPVERKRKE